MTKLEDLVRLRDSLIDQHLEGITTWRQTRRAFHDAEDAHRKATEHLHNLEAQIDTLRYRIEQEDTQ